MTRAFLLVNPRSGDDAVPPAELVRAAEAYGVATRVLAPGDDLAALARAAAPSVEALAMAGGDGSLACVAAVAVAAGLPFACIPYGTKNHFARDAGLDRDDPLGALAALGPDGVERHVDLGVLHAPDGSTRPFLNGVSVGVYASLVERRERRRRRGEALARARALLMSKEERAPREIDVDGDRICVRALLVTSNAQDSGSFSLGGRARLDEGLLHAYAIGGLWTRPWRELEPRPALELGAPAAVLEAAVDGEPVRLPTPWRLELQPGALRLLVPPGGPEAPGRR